MPGPENTETHQSLRPNSSTNYHKLVGESSGTSDSGGNNYRTNTQYHTPKDSAPNHESNDERLSESAVAIPLTLLGRIPVDEYYDREQTLEAQEISTLYATGLVEYPNLTQDLPGYHLDREFTNVKEGSRKSDASKNEVLNKIQSQSLPGGSVDRGFQLDEFEYDPIESSVAISEGYPRLDFKPFSIQSWFLALTIIFFLACIGGIATLIWLGHQNAGSFHVATSRNHLAFRYVPTAIGTVTKAWWRTIVTSLARMTPYMSMAAQVTVREDGHRLRRTLQNNYGNTAIDFMGIGPVAQNRHWLLLTCLVTKLVVEALIVPLKAAFLQIVAVDQGWTIIVHREVGYFLICVYVILICANFLVLFRLWNRDTGVKWDPVSVASQLSLVQGSNILGIFNDLDFAGPEEFVKVLQERSPAFGVVRLGYWRHRSTRSIWHGLACIPPSSDSEEWLDYEKLQTQISSIILNDTKSDKTEEETLLDLRPKYALNPEKYRYRHVIPVLNDLSLAIYASIIIVVIALSIVGLVDRRIQDGFNSAFAAYTLNSGNAALGTGETLKHAILYSSLPAFVMSIPGALWLSADFFYRITEPFAGMSEAATANLTILLDYPTCTPGLVSLKAAMNGHWRVALFSVLSLVATVPPVIVQGLFTTTPTATGYYMSIEPPNFWACFMILIMHLFILPIARPTPDYRLPRPVRTIADVLSYCYTSRVLDDRGPDGKPIFFVQEIDDERVHLESKIHLAKKTYEFGLYLGKDGQRHMGFDVSNRTGADGREVRVTKFAPGVGIYGFGDRLLWRKPRVLPNDA